MPQSCQSRLPRGRRDCCREPACGCGTATVVAELSQDVEPLAAEAIGTARARLTRQLRHFSNSLLSSLHFCLLILHESLSCCGGLEVAVYDLRRPRCLMAAHLTPCPIANAVPKSRKPEAPRPQERVCRDCSVRCDSTPASRPPPHSFPGSLSRCKAYGWFTPSLQRWGSIGRVLLGTRRHHCAGQHETPTVWACATRRPPRSGRLWRR